MPGSDLPIVGMWGHGGGVGKSNLICVNYIKNICLAKLPSTFLMLSFTSKNMYGLFAMQIFWIKLYKLVSTLS